MKISRLWCADFLESPPPPAAELAELLTARGLEVGDIRLPVAVGVVLGEVISCAAHPQADNLSVCRVVVDGDSSPLTIVCGAANVRAGMFAAVAPPGAELDGRRIERRQIRGVESQGMLCSAAELSLGEDADGILELSAGDGEKLAAFLDDAILDVGVTPNRGDCLSHLGIAREISAAAGIPLLPPPSPAEAEADEAETDEAVTVRLDAAEDCPYYGCLLIRGVDCSRPSPWWLRARIERCGGRGIGAAVDATNYIMLAIGQPLHAFDAGKLTGGIIVRRAAAGEGLQLLDGSSVKCGGEDLLIADESGAVALGGVMGGMATSVTADTRDILLEAAFFTPAAVRGRARRFNLSSEAAFRFERGVDSDLPAVALPQAARLIQQLCGGRGGRAVFAGNPPRRPPVCVSAQKVRRTLGVDISADEAARLLNQLHLPTLPTEQKNGEEMLSVETPAWRFDLQSGVDLIEEIARAWGYGRLPETLPRGGRVFSPPRHAPLLPARAREFFSTRGFFEAITYSFVPVRRESELSETPPLPLLNPLSEETAAMRTTLWGGLLDRAKFNLRRRRERVCLFEIGRCFFPPPRAADLPAQPTMLGGILCGRASPSGWAADSRPLDFYDAKGMVESFLGDCCGVTAFFAPADAPPPALHPGKTANIFCGGGPIGRLGELHPAHPDAAEFKSPPILFELNLDEIPVLTAARSIAAVSRFPAVFRDLSVVSDDTALLAGELLSLAVRVSPSPPVVDVQLFDFYAAEEDNTLAGKKGFGLRLWMQGGEANLLGEEIDRVVGGVLEALQNEYGVVQREAATAQDSQDGGERG